MGLRAILSQIMETLNAIKVDCAASRKAAEQARDEVATMIRLKLRDVASEQESRRRQ